MEANNNKKDKKPKTKSRARYILSVILFILFVVTVSWCLENYFKNQPQSQSKPQTEQFDILSLIGSGVEVPARVGNHQVVEHTGYTLSYNEEHEVADWVAYEFTRSELETQTAQRKDNFREDPLVTTGSAKLADYKGSGYSRGHLAPAADFNWSEQAMSDTFYLSNMTPQKQSNFNAGIWLKAENFVREVCSQNLVVFVATGPVLTDGPYDTIGESGVSIPKNFYKVLLALDPDGVWTAWAMVIPHDAKASDDVSAYFCTIDQVEEITNLDFFPLLPDNLEDIIESSASGIHFPS